MAEAQVHDALAWAVIVSAAAAFLYLMRKAAPYGRHYAGAAWGGGMPAKLGWIVMELPTTIFFAAVYLDGSAAGRLVPIAFMAMWQLHYLNRTFVYPFRCRRSDRRMPIAVVGSGFLFNSINAYINARQISEFGMYDAQWLADPRFLAGLGIFLAGMALNLHADNVLRRLRKPGETIYAVPRGRAFNFVSCPNYLGEILEWMGWAIATWSFSGLAFCLFTAANLAPRARSHHLWYKATFPDYPARRRALIPGVF